jgi:hypothetical protein
MDQSHILCNTLFFKDQEQVNNCFKSKLYKQKYAIHYVIIGFVVSTIIAFMTSSILYDENKEKASYNKIVTGVLFIGVIAATYGSYIYGYNSADIETLNMALSEDQAELARIEGKYKDRNDAIENIINDREKLRNAYSQGYNSGNWNTRSSFGVNSRFNNGPPLFGNIRSGFGR